MYAAFESDNPATRIALAHDALDLSPDCADAWVLLAEEEADTVQRALEYYQQGVAAGERALGAEFQELVGHFWGVWDTRPNMRAKAGLARTLWKLNRLDDAIAQYREMLALNPNDNQGIRDVLVDLLLHLERWDELDALLKKYKEDWTVVWRYTTALNEFRKGGASAKANKALRDAFEENEYVAAYLTGEKRVPKQVPVSIEWGGESEAQYYAGQHLNYWRRVPGAVDWLRDQMQKTRAQNKAKEDKTRSGMPKGKGGKRKV
jgi:tetratricopeptide (TPR) repeat protein